MGGGKTTTTLTALRILKDRGEIKKTLIVAPLRVARKVWPDEIKRWSHLRYKLTVSVAAGGRKPEQIKALQKKADIHTINIDNFKWLIDHFKKEGDSRLRLKWPWDTVIIDESSLMKSGGGKGSKRWQAFKRVYRHVNRIWELTGSPGQLIDYWAQIYFLDQGTRLGRTLTAYRNRWFYKPEYKYSYYAFPHSEKEILERIQDIVFSARPEDYYDLPPVTYNPITVEMSEEEMIQYRHFCKKRWVELEGEKLSAINAGVLFQKCLQFANGAAYYNDDQDWIEFSDCKLLALKEQMQIALSSHSPMLIVYAFKHDLVRIKRLADELKVKNYRVLKTTKDEDDWNAGKLSFLLLHPRSGGHGLNLQHGGQDILFFSLTPSLELFEQVRDRIAGGKRRVDKNVTVHCLVTENTTDEDLPHILKEKEGQQDRAFEALKKRFDFVK